MTKTYYWGGYAAHVIFAALYWRTAKKVTVDLSDVPRVMG